MDKLKLGISLRMIREFDPEQERIESLARAKQDRAAYELVLRAAVSRLEFK